MKLALKMYSFECRKYFPQFGIAFSASTRWLCVFILPLGRHANCYVPSMHEQMCMPKLDIQIQNTIQNIQYVGLGSLRDTLCRFVKVNLGLTTQVSIIITGLLTQICTYNV